jgi:hypothetical protein
MLLKIIDRLLSTFTDYSVSLSRLVADTLSSFLSRADRILASRECQP